MEHIISFIEWLQANPQLSGIAFVLAFAAILAVGIPGGNALMLASGMLFGTFQGGLLAVTGGVLAAFTTHALVRTAFGNWLDRRAGDQRSSVRYFVQHGNFLLLVIPRLIPVIPFFVINVAMTAAGVPKKSFMLSTFLGLIPIAFSLASIGSEIGSIRALSGVSASSLLLSPGLYLPLGGLILMTVSGWLWVRNHQKESGSGPEA
ncbi:MAG: putative membrane protein YdjX (TVP38/TMEM64 family) [Lysobacterales bacterium]|jgi:uncharacterized membrane protein YdjX (TVP38/TMEM64 family)